MKTLHSYSHSAAIASASLAIPFIIIFLLFRLGFEPSLGSLPTLFQISESHLGSFIVFGAILLLLAAFFVSGYSVIQSKRLASALLMIRSTCYWLWRLCL